MAHIAEACDTPAPHFAPLRRQLCGKPRRIRTPTNPLRTGMAPHLESFRANISPTRETHQFPKVRRERLSCAFPTPSPRAPGTTPRCRPRAPARRPCGPASLLVYPHYFFCYGDGKVLARRIHERTQRPPSPISRLIQEASICNGRNSLRSPNADRDAMVLMPSDYVDLVQVAVREIAQRHLQAVSIFWNSKVTYANVPFLYDFMSKMRSYNVLRNFARFRRRRICDQRLFIF